MTSTTSSTQSQADRRAAEVADARILQTQLRRAELINGRAAMLGIVIGAVVEGLTGFGIVHQIGLGALVDGYAACRTQFLPFCF